MRSPPRWTRVPVPRFLRSRRSAAAARRTPPRERPRPPPAADEGGAPAVTGVPLWRRLLAELLGSAFLAAVVIGSGITAQRLSPGDTGRSEEHTSELQSP